MQKILQTVNLLPIFYTDTPSRCAQNNLSKHCLCHDTGEIPHTFLSYMRVNFHREVSLTLFYFFFDFPVEYLDLSCHFCYNLLWVIVPKTEQNLKRTVVKIEHFTAVFLYPKSERKWQKWQSETALIQCNFISAMMSSTSSIPNSKHPA